jgi:hypothetical protein
MPEREPNERVSTWDCPWSTEERPMTDVSQTPGAIPLQDIFITDELDRQPRRPPDYQAENQGLVALAQALA